MVRRNRAKQGKTFDDDKDAYTRWSESVPIIHLFTFFRDYGFDLVSLMPYSVREQAAVLARELQIPLFNLGVYE
jgi:hypothetical protein